MIRILLFFAVEGPARDVNLFPAVFWSDSRGKTSREYWKFCAILKKEHITIWFYDKRMKEHFFFLISLLSRLIVAKHGVIQPCVAIMKNSDDLQTLLH